METGGHEAVLEVKQVDRFQTGVLVVLRGPPGERIEVVVDQLASKLHCRASHLDVLVHPAALALSASIAEKSENTNRANATMTNPPSLEGHTPAYKDTVYLGAHAPQSCLDLGG